MKYVADDGKEFTNERECKEYEKTLNCYWSIMFGPDTTEGRGFTRRIEINTYGINRTDYEIELLLEYWCYKHFGAPVDFVMDVAPIDAYKVFKSTRESFVDYDNNISTIYCKAQYLNNRIELTPIKLCNVDFNDRQVKIIEKDMSNLSEIEHKAIASIFGEK